MSDTLHERWEPRALAFVPTSSKSLEEVAERAREKGYSDGYAEGLAKGHEEAKRQSDERVAELAALWASMAKPIADNDAQVSEYLLSVVFAVVRSVLRRELATEPALIIQTVESVMKLLSESKSPIEIRLNPSDEELIDKHLSEQMPDAYKIVTDNTVMRGGCIVNRADSLVDASIERRCKLLIDQLVSLDAENLETGEEKTPLNADVITEGSQRLEPDGDNDD